MSNSNTGLHLFAGALSGLSRTGKRNAIMAAISGLFGLLSPGARVVSIKDTYGGSNVLFEEFLLMLESRVYPKTNLVPAAGGGSGRPAKHCA
jgi:cystathionine beta-lyase/cystathionine gamma-synthase